MRKTSEFQERMLAWGICRRYMQEICRRYTRGRDDIEI
jgi:hypothetical protein